MTPNDWDDFAAGWDSNDDVRAYAEKAFDSWTRIVAPLIQELPETRVLDFGCGTGLLTEKLARLCGQFVAVDTSARMIDVLREKIAVEGVGNIIALQVAVTGASIDEHPELGGKFDLIVTSSVCSFLPDYESTLGGLCSLMNPGACFVQWDWLADMPVDRIQAAFNASGLESFGIEESFTIESGGESLPVVMGVGRLRA